MVMNPGVAEEGVAAVERALTVLAAFDEHSPELTLAELAHRTCLYKSTISRLLVSLRKRGFVERTDSGHYRIGPQAWRVGSLFALDLTLEKILLPIMEELSNQTRESVSYYVPLLDTKPPMRLCLLRVHPPRRIRDVFHVGSRLPISKGAGGLIFRAFTHPFHKEDDSIRAERVAVSWGDIDPEVCALAAPVMGPDGQLVGALVLSAPSIRHDRSWGEAVKPLVLAAADKATKALKPLRMISVPNAPKGFEHESARFETLGFPANPGE